MKGNEAGMALWRHFWALKYTLPYLSEVGVTLEDLSKQACGPSSLTIVSRKASRGAPPSHLEADVSWKP